MALAFYNGKFLQADKINIGINDLGFTRGLTFFETMRVYHGKPFHLNDHLARLREGCAAIGLEIPASDTDIAKAVKNICENNKFSHSAIRFYVTAGVSRFSPVSLGAEQGFTPNLIIVEDEIPPERAEAYLGMDVYRRGLAVKIVPHERTMPEIKSANYVQAYAAGREAGPEWDDILFTHHDGYVTEASRANFFCVINGILCTPDKNILRGVTRKIVLDIAKEMDIPSAEREIKPEELAKATEAFLSSSTLEMAPIGKINEHIMPATLDAPIFSRLKKAFREKTKM